MFLPLKTKTSATTLPESAIIVQWTWLSKAFAGGVEQNTGYKDVAESRLCFSFSTSRRTAHRHLPVCMVASEALQFSPPAFLHHQIGWAHPPTVTKVDARSRDSTWLKNKLIQVSHGVTTTEQTYRKGWERTRGGRYRMSAAGDAGRATRVTRWKEHGQCRHWHAVPPPTFFHCLQANVNPFRG